MSLRERGALPRFSCTSRRIENGDPGRIHPAALSSTMATGDARWRATRRDDTFERRGSTMGLFGKRAEPEAPAAENVNVTGNAPPVAYGIEDAIKLMRSLPVDQNLELVVRVIKGTLESMSVRLPTIIEDAARKQQSIQDRTAALNTEIGGLEKEIAKRREEIAGLEADFAETTKVKQHLELAESGTKPSALGVPPVPGSHSPPPLPPPAPRAKPGPSKASPTDAKPAEDDEEERKTLMIK